MTVFQDPRKQPAGSGKSILIMGKVIHYYNEEGGRENIVIITNGAGSGRKYTDNCLKKSGKLVVLVH